MATNTFPDYKAGSKISVSGRSRDAFSFSIFTLFPPVGTAPRYLIVNRYQLNFINSEQETFVLSTPFDFLF